MTIELVPLTTATVTLSATPMLLPGTRVAPA